MSVQIDKNRFVYKASKETWAQDLFQKQAELFWLPQEIPMGGDISDWNDKATDADKAFIKAIMLLFTQSDADVQDSYLSTYLPFYQQLPHKMMLTMFTAIESVHIVSYAYLVDSLALGDGTFSAFLDNENCVELHKMLHRYDRRDDVYGRYKAMCMTTCMGEGVALFAQFSMLINYARHNLFKGMAQIVSFSNRDEDLHVAGITELMKRDPEFKKLSIKDRRDMFIKVRDRAMPLILNFAKDCFDMGQPQGLTFAEIQEFIEYQAARRYEQLGLGENKLKNPLPWFDMLVSAKEHASFFETKVTAYQKNALTGKFVY